VAEWRIVFIRDHEGCVLPASVLKIGVLDL